MTNLKLPELSYDSLMKLAPETGKWRKVAYETSARRVEPDPEYAELGAVPVIEVRHFRSVIARISPVAVVIDNHGYHTRTTCHRIDRVLRDNDTCVRACIRNHEMTAWDPRTGTALYPMTAGRRVFHRQHSDS